mmetsp:Transcript_53843/g.96435  ORF Transcript_53843/g.96435 Transcript_53843/m.96435 type:complete len:134 (-) Transcript_53843:16-417(-)
MDIGWFNWFGEDVSAELLSIPGVSEKVLVVRQPGTAIQGVHLLGAEHIQKSPPSSENGGPQQECFNVAVRKLSSDGNPAPALQNLDQLPGLTNHTICAAEATAEAFFSAMFPAEWLPGFPGARVSHTRLNYTE